MKRFRIFLLTALSLLFVTAASAATIDFDDVSSMMLIDNQYSAFGVIFSTSGEEGYSDGHAYARSSSSSLSSPNIIGSNRSAYPYLNDAHNYGIASFPGSTNNVEVWAIPRSNEFLSAWLRLYNSSDQLIDTVMINSNVEGEADLLSYTSPDRDIARAEFSGAGSRVTFDDLSFNVVPEPISSTLFLAGGSLLAVRRLFKRRG